MSIDQTLQALSQIAHEHPEIREKLKVFAFEQLLDMPVVFTDQHGLRFVLYPGQNAKVYFENKGNYEVAETELCKSVIRPGMCCVDVGGNIGFYALLFSKLVGPTGIVHSFEAEEKNYRRLLTNMALNGTTNLHAHRQAVYKTSGEVTLNVFPDSVNAWHTLGSLSLPDPWKQGQMLSPTEQQRIPAVSLDDFCLGKGISKIDFLKVDVEGAELDVFQGCSRMFSQGAISRILFEISVPQVEAMGHSVVAAPQFLLDHGFRIHEVLPTGQLGPEVQNISAHYQNYFAVLRNLEQRM